MLSTTVNAYGGQAIDLDHVTKILSDIAEFDAESRSDVGCGIAASAATFASINVDPNTGFSFLVPSFVVVVIGGLGSFWARTRGLANA